MYSEVSVVEFPIYSSDLKGIPVKSSYCGLGISHFQRQMERTIIFPIPKLYGSFTVEFNSIQIQFNSILDDCFVGAEIIPVYGMNYLGRDEPYKPQPKKMKDRLERQNRLNSPPSIYKSNVGCNNMYNGYGKVHGNLGGGGGGGSSPGAKKTTRGARSSPRSSEPDLQGKDFCSSLVNRSICKFISSLFWE